MASQTLKKNAFELGTARILSTEPLDTSDAKWLGLKTINWIDEEGKERKWECAERKKNVSKPLPDHIDGKELSSTLKLHEQPPVAILALVSQPNQAVKVALVLQYRPPVGKVVVELPAGLVDGDEPVEATALRELYEETGYGKGEEDGGVASVKDVQRLMVCDPGLSNATMALVTIEVKLKSDAVPQPQPDEGEHIIVKLVELRSLKKTLDEYSSREGYTVDARLMHLAYGLSL
ncbi:hypothetical protein CROQUDRAFT_131009 [Cronartium quercuum f. sp. fusiforme G11]|uniref:Nudix hydrolase domain-containing protein n=1 Tax=Cronartium quercuum f. sp. fusiforme G11 TaxID=708437 RepID=A0A9P6NUJ7_9BASI|nr:hypothetical protein CROQUDRAFT_131009 [Cronartium quercuum f. sp. fusiforme G11]